MNVLEQISEGMKVLDSANHQIGTVEYVKLVEVDPATGQPIAEGIEEEADDTSLIEDLAAAFRADDLPDEVQSRLLHDGFVKMDSDALFSADRYVLPDQIASVSGDSVVLKVTKDELIKRH